MAAKPTSEQVLGHYHLLERLGEGGMGVVYRARDERLQRDVAIKVLPASTIKDESARRRLRREALTLARLNHPNIETLHDFETEADVDFLVTEYVSGVTLAAKIANGPLRESELLEYAVQIASALEEAHKRGVIHRDLKPANILIDNNEHVKVLDFGLAQLLTADEAIETVSESASVSGTLPYIAPEQISDPQAIDNRTDLYSCGVVLYEMATGRRPYSEKSVAPLLEAILHRQPPAAHSLNPAISPELETIVRKAMDKDPALRYQSARELKVDLQRLVSGRKLLQLPAAARASAGKRWITAVLATIAALSIAFELVNLRWKLPLGSPLSANVPRVVAVLPFDAVGGNRDHQALCRGLTDLLTTRLAMIGKQYGVEVVPASEVRAQGVNSIGDARRKLGVTLVVEGSWDFAGGQVMYSLVDAQSRRSLNAEFMRANVNDPFSVERSASDSLLAMMAGEFRPKGQKPPASEVSVKPDAYQYYVRGVGRLLEYQDVNSLNASVALFTSAFDRDPSFAAALAGMAEAYWRLYQETKDESWLPKATEAAHRAKTLNDQVVSVHTTLGLIYQGTSKYSDAVQEFKRALELDPTSDAAYRGLAASYEAQGNNQDAEAAYRKAIDIRKDYWGGYSALGAFYAKNARYEDAATQFRRVIELAPENVRGYSNLSGVYLFLGKPEQAEQLLQKSLAIEPNYRAYANLGSLYFSQARYSESAESFQKALKMNDRDGRIWRNLGDAYHWTPGQHDNAAAAYGHAADLLIAQRKINPQDPKVMVELALCFSALGKSRQAFDLIRQAHSLSPSDPEILFRTAEIYEQSGDHDVALKWLGQAINKGYSVSDIEHDPTLQSLRENPRYKQLMQQESTMKR